MRIKQWLKITPALADPGDAVAGSEFVLIIKELAQKYPYFVSNRIRLLLKISIGILFPHKHSIERIRDRNKLEKEY